MIEPYIFTSALKDFLRPKQMFGWLAVILAVSTMSWLMAHELPSLQAGGNSYVFLSAALVFRILPLCAAIFSTAVVSQEVSQKTIVYLLTRPIPRWKLLVFRTLAAMVAVFVVSAVTAVGVSLATKGFHNPLLLRDLKAILAGSAAYTALFTFVSLLINRSMIVCLLFAFVWETAVPNMTGDLYRISISGYLTSISERPAMEGTGAGLDALAGLLGVNIIPPSVAWMTIIGLTLFCLALGGYWFGHFEYNAREDGE